MAKYEQLRSEAVDRMKTAIVMDCLLGADRERYSRKTRDWQSPWECVPRVLPPKGRIEPDGMGNRHGKIYIPVKEFFKFAKKLGIDRWLITKAFTMRNTRLYPGAEQACCYVVEY